MNTNTRLPDFLNYKEDNRDAGYETMQDFFLSWTLRCSAENFKEANQKLFEYARRTIYFLIYGENGKDEGDGYSYYWLNCEPESDFSVQSVKVSRQWNYIDLVAEIEISINGKKEKHLLNIENKYYTEIREGQLENARRVIEEHYKDFDKISHLVIFCDNELLHESTKKHCENCGFKLLSILDIIDYAKMTEKGSTGNNLFDEYWFNFYIPQLEE